MSENRPIVVNSPRSPIDVLQYDVLLRVERMLLEIDVLEVGVHVEPGAAEVVGARDVGNDALPAAADLLQTHPHVPVPHLEMGDKAILLKKVGTSLRPAYECHRRKTNIVSMADLRSVISEPKSLLPTSLLSPHAIYSIGVYVVQKLGRVIYV